MADTVSSEEKFSAIDQQLQTLAQEMTAAMEAISGNALSTLEESVANQEMLCASLTTMSGTVQRDLHSTPVEDLPGELDAVVAMNIRDSCKAIEKLTLQYAALLKHSGKSTALLSALYKNQTGQFQEVRGSRLKHQTWSCEM